MGGATIRRQFNIKTLLLVIFAMSILAASYKVMPEVPGFRLEFSRKFFLACLVGGLIMSLIIASLRHPFASWRFTQSLIISTTASAWIGYGALLIHAGQESQSPQWPGMASIYLFPASTFLSVVSALFFSFLLPIQKLEAIFGNNGKE